MLRKTGVCLAQAWMPVNSSLYNPEGWFCTNGGDRRLCLEPQPWAIMSTKMVRETALRRFRVHISLRLLCPEPVLSSRRVSGRRKLNESHAAQGEPVLNASERTTLVQSMDELLHLDAPGTWVTDPGRGVTGAAVASKCWHNGSSGFPCGYHENAGASNDVAFYWRAIL